MSTRQSPWPLLLTASLLLLASGIPALALADTKTTDTKTLVSFATGFDVDTLTVQDARPAIVSSGEGSVLQVATGQADPWPGIAIQAPGGGWDLSAFVQIELTVKNVADHPVRVHLRVDCPGGDGEQNSVTSDVMLVPGETRQLSVPLRRRLPAQLADQLFGMRGFPGGCVKEGGLDVTQITKLIVFLNHPTTDNTFQLGDIRATGTYEDGGWASLAPDEFFPLIDRFGQFRHTDWPGKTHSDEELHAALEQELADLQAQPGPADWNQYGGWAAGPQLPATGFFYATKHADKWWLVDPEGRLFWSHGVDCVGFGNGITPITDREHYFAELPDAGSPAASYYGTGSWAPHNYYENRGEYRTFNFQTANLLRKFGEDWLPQCADIAHRRLRAWSMNTIANWSDPRIYAQRRTPYVVSASSGGAKPIEVSTGYWGKLPDPFDPSFRAALERRMESERSTSAGDPFCIGYFVDNELGWGDELSLANAALASPPEQAAKRVFLTDLEQKYETIDRLNAAWGTDHASWQALLDHRSPPDATRARAELQSFYTRIAEEYFRICREVVKQVAPDQLYLGCRFAWVNDRVARAAAKYCDVIGYNLYETDVRHFRLPEGLDRPVIIGEFHFGALDRGMFHTGLRPTASQQARADAYRSYVTGALNNPCLVGTHWFQYSDQATTGRGDGENYQIGLVDICDRPYPETIEAVREVGAQMYRTRLDAP